MFCENSLDLSDAVKYIYSYLELIIKSGYKAAVIYTF